MSRLFDLFDRYFFLQVNWGKNVFFIVGAKTSDNKESKNNSEKIN